jgi:hypothetical protein
MLSREMCGTKKPLLTHFPSAGGFRRSFLRVVTLVKEGDSDTPPLTFISFSIRDLADPSEALDRECASFSLLAGACFAGVKTQKGQPKKKEQKKEQKRSSVYTRHSVQTCPPW